MKVIHFVVISQDIGIFYFIDNLFAMDFNNFYFCSSQCLALMADLEIPEANTIS